MASEITSLKPENIWKHFSELLKIPHCSGHEQAVANHICQLAANWQLEAQKDKVGNVLVRLPASPGHQQVPGVILQAHLDMVCEKNSELEHDFQHDPIEAVVDGEWVKARGTSLGADNGIGVATCLAVLEDRSLVHGPVECLFTIDEETGLTGAYQLKKGLLKGKILLNLDSEDEGTFTIGCAGGADSELTLPVQRKAKKNRNLLVIKLKGLHGGHSGLDINLGRGNAIKLLARLLSEAAARFKFDLVSFHGGSKRNAIPREAVAVLAIEPAAQKGLILQLKKDMEAIKFEYRVTEPEINLEIKKSEEAGYLLTSESQARLLNLILSLPHGVIAMHPEISGLVETSSNLAIVETQEKRVMIICNTRSSVSSALQAVRLVIKANATLAAAKINQPDGYPAWTPDLKSPLLQRMIEIYRHLFQREPEVKAVHAGLECGIIGEKYPDLDMISIGPTIRYPHSPEEKVNIESVGKFWELVVETLKELA
ncbi:MAG: aminoacyl-histidine dipeptidase [Acidobacteriota bacterium]|nr:aminoacyl-histidine dipeptidase [Acidobacteriota bacterium]